MASFRPSENAGALIALRALRTGKFNRQGEGDQQAVWLDVWVLDGPQAGKFFSDSVNTSRLGRQFESVAGNGQVYFGRVRGETSGSGGTSYILGEREPRDAQTISGFEAKLAANPNLGAEQAQVASPPPSAAPVDPWAQPQPQAQQATVPPASYAAPPLAGEPPF
jgi:hypothetical protein